MTHSTPDQQAAELDAILRRAPVLPVLTIERLEDAVPLARALVEAGLPVLEVTLRTRVALEAIARIALEVPEAVVGAGTILRPLDLEQVAEAGADFAIAPGTTDALYAAARTTAIPFLPAIATASELMRGMEHGHQRFKFFPAAAMGGPVALKAFGGPFPQARFCPTGGIDADTAPGYLALPNVLTVGGAWMAPPDAVAGRDWARIGRLAREAVGAAFAAKT